MGRPNRRERTRDRLNRPGARNLQAQQQHIRQLQTASKPQPTRDQHARRAHNDDRQPRNPQHTSGWGVPSDQGVPGREVAPPAVTPPTPVADAPRPPAVAGVDAAPADADADADEDVAAAPTGGRPPDVPPDATWWPGCGRRARAGDRVPAGESPHAGTVLLSGDRRAWRRVPPGCPDPLTDAQVHRLLRRARDIIAGRRPWRAAVAVLLADVPEAWTWLGYGGAGASHPVLPDPPRDRPSRTRAMRRWTCAVLGRAHQRSAVVRSVRRVLSAADLAASAGRP